VDSRAAARSEGWPGGERSSTHMGARQPGGGRGGGRGATAGVEARGAVGGWVGGG
jgi:hypothetical protein